MPNDVPSALALVKEGGALVLLAWTLFKAAPAVIAALDRVERVLYRIEGQLGIKDTDRIESKSKSE